jgi:hypothetical protein
MILREGNNIFIGGHVTPDALFRTAWTGNSIIPLTRNTRRALTVSSSSANDNDKGTGARSIRITGLTDEFVETSGTVDLKGQTGVSISDNFIAIQSIEITDAGSTGYNEGDIYVGEGTITAGVPATAYEKIAIRDGISHTIRYTVPKGKTLYINKINVSRPTDKYIIVEALKHVRDFHIVMDQRAYHQGSTQIEYPVPLVINEREVFTVEVQKVAASAEETYIEVYGEEK